MKKKLNSIFVVFLLVTSIVSGSGIVYFVLSAGQGVVLSVEPQTVNVKPDQVFTLSVHVDNVENLFKWMLSISWDPAVMELDPASISAIAEGSFLEEAGRTVFRPVPYVAGSGYLSCISCELTQPTSSSGSGTLLTIRFKAVGDGETSITISNSVLYNNHKQKISHTCKTGHVSVLSAFHDVAVSLEAPTRLVLGDSMLLKATAQNLGDVDETNVNLTILVNDFEMASQTVSLVRGQSYTLSISWVPSYKGVYNVTAYAIPVLGETETRNNYDALFVEVVSRVHDLAISLLCPTRLVLGKSAELIATVANVGTFDETNVEASIIINGVIKKSESIALLAADSSKKVTYVWNPAYEGTYNVTTYVRPAEGETSVINNRDSRFVQVVIPAAEPAILIVADDDGYYHHNGTSLAEFECILKSSGYGYDIWKESLNRRPSLQFLLNYELVIWTCGDYSYYAVDRYDAQTLEQYVNQGGNILLEGGNIAYDHGSDGFMTNVAHAQFKIHGTRSSSLTVVKPEHPVSSNLPLNFSWATPPKFNDGVHPVNGGFAVINFSDTPYSGRYGEPWTAVIIFDGTQIGVGSMVYCSFVLSDLPQNEKETLVVNSIEWLRIFGVSTVLSNIIYASANFIYFIYGDPNFVVNASSYDLAVGATVYAFCENPQRQGFTVTENWVAPLGEIKSTEIINTTVVVLGNPTHHIVTNYYENHGFTPISLSENSTHFIFLDDSRQIVGTLHKQALESGHQDMFVVEAFKDGKNDFLVIYGIGWRGTWAASIYLANAILKDLAEYSDAYFVFNWVDDGTQDGIPQFSEISKANFG